jgi:Xaa-Pro aminopeptidase
VVNLEASSGYDRGLTTLVAAKGWRRLAFEAGDVPVARWRRWTAGPGEAATSGVGVSGDGLTLVDTEQIVETVRARKDEREVAILREAARRLSSVTREVLADVVRAGRTELEIAADIDWRIKRAGFEKTAFDTIVASGPNSALPHARPTTRHVQAGDLVVLDFGGVQDGYCVDLTRTVGIGQVGEAERRMYDAVLAAHGAAVAAAGRSGVETGEVDAAARETLRGFDLDRHFGHGTGHGLGLDVHELPRLSRRTAEHPGHDVLEPGMVFTIEPGAYVDGVGGVRIEDDLLRTVDGAEVLTDPPRDWMTIPV